MANRALLNTLRLYHELMTCPCTGAPLCPGCEAKNEQIALGVKAFLIEVLGNRSNMVDAKHVCQLYALLKDTHDEMHNRPEDDK